MTINKELLEALKALVDSVTGVDQVSAVNEARAAIAKAEAERVEPAKPVAWYIKEHGDIADLEWDTNKPNTTWGDWKPLYTTLPAAAVSELTDEQIFEALKRVDYETQRLPVGLKLFARAIEAAIRSK